MVQWLMNWMFSYKVFLCRSKIHASTTNQSLTSDPNFDVKKKCFQIYFSRTTEPLKKVHTPYEISANQFVIIGSNSHVEF
jgi:hypothetical protein